MSAERHPPSSFRQGARAVPPAVPEGPLATYDVSWLDAQGRERWETLRLPAEGAVGDVVATFARGTPIETPRGPVAVEDLLPGDRVRTPSGSAALRWCGSRSHGPTEARPTLYRIGEGAFGRGRPAGDVVLGAGAHVLAEGPRCRPLVGSDAAFAPVAAFEDAMHVIAVQPPGEVATYGLACEGQEAVIVGGIAVGSYHPAREMMRRVTPATLEALHRLIPPLAEGFGAARIPYLTATEAQSLNLP
ncbi:Hint domain-containing protein [Jannaschia sp. W003]|uniref:Hint domain-containing protein n=1 Tax=Jannaschia sp. W003 TaxID=2867012 RepID=UPI0021A9580D|nr:Hint domain-containing protein [Jannaschia sp. W003]UWQ21363.1 Hint domain-containing protein [Jannaschia sp. W003]